jgi:hypothetical protein
MTFVGDLGRTLGIPVATYPTTCTSQVLGCNDDAPNTFASRVSFSNLIEGTRLLITLEGYAGECGSVHLNIAKN